MTELEKAARMALGAISDIKGYRPDIDRAITALTQALATTERTKAELIAQARDLIEAQEHAHAVGYRMGFAAATERKGEPVAWAVMNGLTKYQVCGSKASADALCTEMQKRHDLSGSLAAFHVAPLYTSTQVPEDVQRDAERYRKIKQGSAWPCAFASHDAPEPLTGDDLDAAIDATRKGE